MTDTIKCLFPALAVALLSACGTDLLAPPRTLSRTDVAARAATTATLTTSASSSSVINLSWVDNAKNETGWAIDQLMGSDFQTVATGAANATQHVQSGLTSATTYCFRVRAFKRTGNRTVFEPPSNTSCATTHSLPGPTALQAKPFDGVAHLRGVALTWQHTSTNHTAVVIEQASSAGGPWTAAHTDIAPFYDAYELYNVAVEQQLCYRVRTRFGNELSAPSNVECTFFPAAPSGLSAAPSSSAISLSWTDNSAGEEAYVVERATGVSGGSIQFGPLATLPANATGYVDQTVAPDTAYWYRVWAVRDGSRATVSTIAIAGILTKVPTAPTINAYPSSSSVIEVEVTPTSADQEGFRFERSADGVSGWVAYGTNTILGFSDVGRQPEVSVCYRVIAFNGLGDSPPSPVDCATPPAAPSEVQITSPDVFVFHITWQDNSNVEDGYEVVFMVTVCDAERCWEEPQGIVLPANTTEYMTDNYQFVGVRAIKDGGYSDWGAMSLSAAALRSQPSGWTDIMVEARRAMSAGITGHRAPTDGRMISPARKPSNR